MLAIALIPSVALMGIGITVVSVLGGQARTVGDWYEFREGSSDLVQDFVRTLQQERTISVRVRDQTPGSAAALPGRRQQTDTAMLGIRELTASTARQFEAIAELPAFTRTLDLLGKLATIRAGVDSGQLSILDIDTYYSDLVENLAEFLVQTAVPNAPNNQATAEELGAVTMLRVADTHARAIARATSRTVEGAEAEAETRIISTFLLGARRQLAASVGQLGAPTQDGYRRLIGTEEWKLAQDGENQLMDYGQLLIPYPDWIRAEEVVGARLADLFVTQLGHSTSIADDAASNSARQATWAGIAVLSLIVATFGLAVMLAQRLVRRLLALRSRSLELADRTLPALIDRIRDGGAVDLDAEIGRGQPDGDEIDQVAAAFATAQRTAVNAALEQARTRSGFEKVFLDIARRNQAVIRKQLEVLDLAESKQNDPEHLQLLFDLDHLTTRARRNAENLLILGGSRPGRRWREPVPLEDVVRSAVSETEGLSRVGTTRVPAASVSGPVVADLVHLLAELVDNAANFSPPDAPVAIHGNTVGRGVVVEVEDQGLGIRFEERERLNDTLHNPPDFHEMALDGQRHLGLFVVGRLARRHGITVTLQESAYGGIKSIVRIPTEALSADPAPRREQTTGAALSGGPPVPERIRPGGRDTRFDPSARQIDHTGRRMRPTPAAAAQTGHGPGVPDSLAAPNGATPQSVDTAAEIAAQSTRAIEPVTGTAVRVTQGRAPLPRRARQSHLAPELQRGHSAAAPVAQPEPLLPHRSAEFARGTMSAFQRGTRQARTAATDPQ
ncbi:ATP-binding protein [Nocardia sp. NPDC050378]|uniref:sensor histidine kinase n=1 Tax=Nocardia sp. NPDC050378 TaxID=3155400 RepID=UPI0033E8062C